MVGINQNCILGITHFNFVNLKIKKKKIQVCKLLEIITLYEYRTKNWGFY